MPDVLTHTLCGKKALKRIKNKKIRDEVYKRQKLFNIGCQGPDIFIYYRSWPWTDKGKLKEFGHVMHETKTGQFFLEGIKFLKQCEKGSKEYYDMLTYLLGFICHFNMDKVAHPYIFYFGGIDDGTKEKKKYSNYHKRLEIALDVLILKRDKGKDAYKYPVYKLLKRKTEMPNVICKFYKEVFEKLYNTKIELDTPKIAVGDMVKLLKVLYDPMQLKRIMSKVFYHSCNFSKYISYTIYPKKLKPNIDYLNLEHRKWQDPINKEIIYTYSFVDLFDKGVKDSSYYMDKVIDYINNREVSYEELKKLFKDISYATSIECGHYKDMKNYDCLFE